MTDPATARLFRNALCQDGLIGDLAVRDGRFVDRDALGGDADIVDLKGLLVLPAFVDGGPMATPTCSGGR